MAVTEIERTLRDAANARLPHAFEEADLRQAIGVTQAIYRSNVFPSMKVGWGMPRIRSGTRCRLDVSAATTRITRRRRRGDFVRTASYVTASSKAQDTRPVPFVGFGRARV